MRGIKLGIWGALVTFGLMAETAYAVVTLVGSGQLATQGAIDNNDAGAGAQTAETLDRVPDTSSKWERLTLDWTVEFDDSSNLWTYTYDWEAHGPNGSANPSISHFTIEASDNFTASDAVSHTGPGTFVVGQDGSSEPDDGGVDKLYGIKWDSLSGTSFMGSVTTARAPIWGDAFIKDGTVDAVNTGYDAVDPDISQAGNELALNMTDWGWVAVPDTFTSTGPTTTSTSTSTSTTTSTTTTDGSMGQGVPEPLSATLALVSVGGIAVSLGRRRVA